MESLQKSLNHYLFLEFGMDDEGEDESKISEDPHVPPGLERRKALQSRTRKEMRVRFDGLPYENLKKFVTITHQLSRDKN